MKKRILALILCALVAVASVPLAPVGDLFSIEATAGNVEELQRIFDSAPTEDEWGDYHNGSSIKGYYNYAAAILKNHSAYTQQEIDECARDLEEAIAALTPYATGLFLNKNALSLAVGTSYTLTATPEPSNAGGNVSWSSSSSGYVTVDSKGKVSVNRYTSQPVEITAEIEGKDGEVYSASCFVETKNPVAGVSLSAENLVLYNGAEETLTATLVGTDATAKPTGTAIYTWHSDNTSVATVDDNGKVKAKGVGTCKITLTVRSESGEPYTDECNITVNKLVPVESFQVLSTLTSGKLILTSRESETFRLLVLPSDASVKNIRWSTSDPKIVSLSDITVSESGVASVNLNAGEVGTARITYTSTDGSEKSGYFDVEVRPLISDITLSHTSKAIRLDSSGERIVATVSPANAGNQVLRWTSDDERICKVDYNGVLYPQAIGECTITVTTTDKSDIVKTCKVIVCGQAQKIELSRTSATLENTQTLRLNASVTTVDGYVYSDVQWTSSDTNIATVDQNGRVTAKYPGPVAIKATAVDGSGVYAICTVNVTQRITSLEIQSQATVAVGKSFTLTPIIAPSYATEKSLSWSTTNSSVATVDINGLVTAKNVGTAKITCTTADGKVSASCTVNVVIPATGILISSESEELWKGDVVQLSAMVTPSTATDKKVIWASSNPAVAKVTSDGLVTAVAGGTCVITAQNSSGNTASCRIEVSEDCTGVELDYTVKSMYVNQTYALVATVLPTTATTRDVVWSSSAPTVASVNQNGAVTAHKEGSATITVRTVNGSFKATCTVTVHSKIAVKGISLDRSSESVNVGEIKQLVAMISPSNASEQGITWSYDKSGIIKIDQTGRFLGVKAGTVVLTATSVDGGFTAKCKITVKQPVTGIRITTSDVKLAVGKSKALAWNVFPDDATNPAVIWSSSAPSVAEVTEAGVVIAKKAGIAVISATTVDGGYTSTCNFTVFVPVSGVSVNATTLKVPKGETRLLQAVIKPDNATNKSVSWVSSNTSIVKVNEAGQVTGVSSGTANVTCTTADGAYKATCVVTVVQLVETVTIDVSSVSLDAGKTKTLTAKIAPSTATYKTVKWSSSNTKIATVDSDGVVKAISGGTVTITAVSADGNAQATCKVTVIQPVTGIKLDRTEGVVRIGQMGTLKATVLPASATNKKVTWSSSDPKRATVSADGVVTGISQGYVNITAKSVNGGYTATCRVLVVKSVTGIKVDKPTLTINLGKTATITPTVYPSDATVKTVYWTSSNYDIANVDENGKITAKAKGRAIITAKTKDGSYTATVDVLVIKPVTGVSLNTTGAYLNLGYKMTLVPTVTPSDASIPTVTWSSSDPTIATVDDKGVVTGIKKGTVTITCKTVNGGKTATCKVAVVKRVTGITLDKASAILYLGRTLSVKSTIYPVDASVQDVTYSSSNSSVATVNANGIVTPVNIGTATITVKTKDGSHTASCTVYVKKAPESIKLGAYSGTILVGQTKQLKYAVYPTDATNRKATFTTSNAAVATVDKDGNITGVSSGTVEITAATENGIKAVCKITVRQSVTGLEMSPAAEVYTGEQIKLDAKILPSDAYNKNILWTSSDSTIATVSSTGVVTGVKTGEVTITAISQENASYNASCTVTVKQHVTSVEFAESQIYINKGKEADLVYSVLPETATNKKVKFESSDSSVVSVTADGHIVTHLGGQAVITVTTEDKGFTAKCYITVVEPVSGIALNYDSKEIFVGSTLELKAIISPSDAHNKLVRWSSDSESASVSSDGVVTALSSGIATITATTVDGNYTASCKLILLQRATSIVTDTPTLRLLRGESHQLNAMVLPEDCYDRTYRWESENEAIATVTADGFVETHAPGVVKLVCTSLESEFSDEVLTVTTTLTVHEPVTAVDITDSQLTLYTPLEKALDVKITPENASDKSLTWTSSDESIATVDENGVVTAVGKGEVTITATSNDTGESDSCSFNVLIGVEGITTEKEAYSVHENTSFVLDYAINPSDADTPDVVFENEDENIFTVDPDGTVHGITLGSAWLTVTSQQNPDVSRKVRITVTRAVTDITLDITQHTVYTGDSFALRENVLPEDASDRSVIWTSSDEKVATVNEKGEVTALSRGIVEIKATTVDGNLTAVCELEVIQLAEKVEFGKDEYTVFMGHPFTFDVAVLPEDTNDKTLTWISSDESIATVDENGVVTPQSLGKCEITAKSAVDGVEKTVSITVVQLAEEIRFYCRIPDLWVGQRVRAIATVIPENATNKDVIWTSGDESIAVVDQYGVITAVSGGRVQIIATSADEGAVKGIINLWVKEEITGIAFEEGERNVVAGESLALTATVMPAGAYDKTVIFTSSDEKIATVDESGRVTGVAPGKVEITASTVGGEFSVTTEITVIRYAESIKLYRDEFVLEAGDRVKIQYDILPADATEKNLIWESSDESVVKVSKEGVITAVAAGTATVTVMLEDDRKVFEIIRVEVSEG